ncbi:MAG TPA: hypothetical protein VNA20_02710 [Frankiaceae bacterium]|nr:hypothetical protein [Frankiaceae bacterium]
MEHWIERAYALPYVPLSPGLPWAVASVEVWADRVVVQVVAPAAEVESPPWDLLGPDASWEIGYASGTTSPLWAGRGDEGEGRVRCYLLFGGRAPAAVPVTISGVLGGSRVTGTIREPSSR